MICKKKHSYVIIFFNLKIKKDNNMSPLSSNNEIIHEVQHPIIRENIITTNTLTNKLTQIYNNISPHFENISENFVPAPIQMLYQSSKYFFSGALDVFKDSKSKQFAMTKLAIGLTLTIASIYTIMQIIEPNKK